MKRSPDNENRWNKSDELNRRSNLPLALFVIGGIGFTLWAASMGGVIVVNTNNQQGGQVIERKSDLTSEQEGSNFCSDWVWAYDKRSEICMSDSHGKSACSIPSGSSNKWFVSQKEPAVFGPFTKVTIYCDNAVSIYTR